jgi:hypothetical protein
MLQKRLKQTALLGESMFTDTTFARMTESTKLSVAYSYLEDEAWRTSES